MKALSSLKSELLAIIHNKKLLIAIIGVMTIPLLYCGMYLWAFWNPYGHLDRMPVAIVNHDKGAVYNGEKLQVGNDLVKNLKKKESFNWQFVSEKDANRGLENQKYYIKVEIPEDFSKNATTLQSDHPKKMELVYTPNEGYNYLSSKIGDSAIEKIKEEISSSVTETYAESMFNSVKNVANGLDKASNGAGDLHQGISQAQTGAESLKDGINSASSGTDKLASGAQSVDTGAKQIEQNLALLAENSVVFSQGLETASSGSKQVNGGLQQFNVGLGQLKDGNTQLIAGAQKSEAGAKQLSDGLNQAKANMPDLVNGSQNIAGGTSDLSSKMGQLAAGADETKAGADSVSQGLQKLVDQVNEKANATNDPNVKAELESLKEDLSKLSATSKVVASGVNQLDGSAALLKQGSDSLAGGATKLNAGLSKLEAGINPLSSGANQLVDGQNQLTQGLTMYGNKLDDAQKGFSQIVGGSSSLSTGLDQLASGSTQLQNGTNQLAQGSVQLASGTDQLSNGGQDLKEGMSKLANGSSDLTTGMGKLTDGSKELSDQLQKGANDASDVKANKNVYNMFAKPVSLKEDRINQVPNYGTGFAPYFLSLSLFIGALMISIIFPMLSPATEPKSGFSWFAGKLGILLVVGIGQAILADAVLLFGLGLEVKSVPYFILLSIISSWTFLAIIQFLVTTLDNPGRFLAVILLTLQLTSSAGTYPIELVPKLLQTINHYLPMTYTVAGFRAVISTGDFSYMWNNIGHIVIFFVIFLAATLTYFTLRFKKVARILDTAREPMSS